MLTSDSMHVWRFFQQIVPLQLFLMYNIWIFLLIKPKFEMYLMLFYLHTLIHCNYSQCRLYYLYMSMVTICSSKSGLSFIYTAQSHNHIASMVFTVCTVNNIFCRRLIRVRKHPNVPLELLGWNLMARNKNHRCAKWYCTEALRGQNSERQKKIWQTILVLILKSAIRKNWHSGKFILKTNWGRVTATCRQLYIPLAN